jgi:hypothetical protein
MDFTAGYEHGTNTNTLMNSWNEKPNKDEV